MQNRSTLLSRKRTLGALPLGIQEAL